MCYPLDHNIPHRRKILKTVCTFYYFHFFKQKFKIVTEGRQFQFTINEKRPDTGWPLPLEEPGGGGGG